MVFKDIRVSMPEKWALLKKRANGGIYVYYIARAYRNKHRKPTSDQVVIGRLDEATGKLIPNNRYFDFFPDHKPLNLQTIHETKKRKPSRKFTISELQASTYKRYGIPLVMMSISKQTGLFDVLQKCFPDKWDSLLATAFYMVSQGNVMMYISDWFSETKVDFTMPLRDGDCSNLFESITDTDQEVFFTKWVGLHGKQEYVTYDVTSLSTYSQNIDIAEWGYNRDNENHVQFNFGMFYAATTGIPIYYDLYNGSIPDKSHLQFVMKNAKRFGIHKTCFVFDCTFVTKDNCSFMFDNNYSFISAFSTSKKEAIMLIDEVKDSIEEVSNWIRKHALYGVQRSFALYGKEMQASIFFAPERKALETKEIHAYIEKLQLEIEELNSNKIPQRIRNYFKVKKQPQSSLSFELDKDKVNKMISRAGFFILLSSNANHCCREMLKVYREKDVIEKNFHQLKNDIDFRRMKTHFNKTTDGKMFVGFLALILRTQMLKALKSNDLTQKLTFDKMLIELKKMKTLRLPNNTEVSMTLTKMQKDILAALNIRIE